MEKKLDLRVQKTRSALLNALYDLMSQKSLDDITVTKICEKAVIRKATFYKHFSDKTELLFYAGSKKAMRSAMNHRIRPAIIPAYSAI